MKKTGHFSAILVFALIVLPVLQAHGAGLNEGDQMTVECSKPASATHIIRNALPFETGECSKPVYKPFNTSGFLSFQNNEYANSACVSPAIGDAIPFQNNEYANSVCVSRAIGDAIPFQNNEYANSSAACFNNRDTLPFKTGEFRYLDDKAADCPEGYQCITFEVECAGSDPARGVIAYGAHTGDVAKGLIMLFKGGEGTAYWTRPPVAYQMAEEFRRNGYDMVQVRWIDSWLLSSPGKDAGIAHLAGRPATVIKEVYDRWYIPLERNAPDGVEPGFCLTGNSGGASQISYALSHYGLDTIMDVVVPTGGPPHATLAKSMLRREGEEDYWYNEKRRAFIDKGFGFFDGNGPGVKHDPAFTERWNRESVATGGTDYYHPGTRLHFIIGGDDRGMYHVSKDYIYRLFAAGNPDITLQIVPGTPHNIMRTQAGRVALKNALLGCQDPSAPVEQAPGESEKRKRATENREKGNRATGGRVPRGQATGSRATGGQAAGERTPGERSPEGQAPGTPPGSQQQAQQQTQQQAQKQAQKQAQHRPEPQTQNRAERQAQQQAERQAHLQAEQQAEQDLLAPIHANVKYGSHERNRFDFWRAESDSPTPLVVFIHGGGFRNGDKSGALNDENSRYLKRCLENGVSFASINYPYNSTTRLDSIMFHAARAIQFFRNKSGRLHIDKDNIAAYGGSAGGGISLWLAVHDDLADPESKDPVLRESSRLTVAGHLRSQATYDFRRWPEFLDLPHNWNTGTDSDLKLYKIPDKSWYDSTEIVSLRKELDMIRMIDPSDPPVYFQNYREGSMARQGDIVHHPAHAIHLSRIFDQQGIDNALMINETEEEDRMDMLDFFFRHLLTDPVRDPTN